MSAVPFLSLGSGPRNCIGQRIGKMFVRTIIYSFFQQYRVELDERQIGKELQRSINLHPIGGIHLLKLKTK